MQKIAERGGKMTTRKSVNETPGAQISEEEAAKRKWEVRWLVIRRSKAEAVILPLI